MSNTKLLKQNEFGDISVKYSSTLVFFDREADLSGRRAFLEVP
jgi:hypothetical protein